MTSIRLKAARTPLALYIVDGDASVREGLTRLAVSAGFEARARRTSAILAHISSRGVSGGAL